MGLSPTRGSSFFLGKVTALGVLCCFALFVCLTLLASFFLPSHLSFKNMYVVIRTHVVIIHVFLMRDEMEGRKEEASKVIQATRQSNTTHPRQSLFLRKMSM